VIHESRINQQLQFLIVALIVHHTVNPAVLKLVACLQVLVISIIPVSWQEVAVVDCLFFQQSAGLLLHKELTIKLLLKLDLCSLVIQIRFALFQELQIITFTARRLK
jgi:hypothetical protein